VVVLLSALAGFVSMVVDNVVVILMFAPVAIPIARHLGLPITPLILMIGFSANFMGSAMLLGDLPPQMMHSVSGAEFFDFIWYDGRPSSFPILTVTFVLTLGIMYWLAFRKFVAAGAQAGPDGHSHMPDAKIPDRLFAGIVLFMFAATIVGMAFREVLNVKLGFIAMTGALLLVLVLELLGDRVKKPSFEDIVQGLDWRAVFFYIALFALVGGLEKTGILEKLAHSLMPMFKESYALGATLLYWVTIPIVGIVEHDAYILTFLYTIRDIGQQGVNPWPLWWMLLWSGTLGSNLTIAGAPALYVANNICEREEGRKIPLGEFLRWSVVFTLVSSAICYVFGMLIWVLPYVE
jgi:Na+/H+ antiporter NhaD/arsenite permease-like protein